jgi:flagellar basal body rod protein FlgF
MTQNTTLQPTSAQHQIGDVEVYGGKTLVQQTQLSFASPSPVTLTFGNLATVGNTVNVLVQISGTVATVTDDAGNAYTKLTSGTLPNGQQYEVWTSPKIAQAPTGVTITTSSDVVSAMLSEISMAKMNRRIQC